MKKVLKFFYLHITLLLFSGIGILSKLAGREPVFSLNFFLYLAGVFILLCIYAVIWQKILKLFSLIIAFSNKAVTIIWGILFGKFIFHEEITLGMICGAILIVAGIIIISFNQTPKRKENQKNEELSSMIASKEGDDIECI